MMMSVLTSTSKLCDLFCIFTVLLKEKQTSNDNFFQSEIYIFIFFKQKRYFYIFDIFSLKYIQMIRSVAMS